MSETTNTRPFVNCKNLKMWKYNEKTGEYSDEPTLDFSDRMTTYTDDVTTNITPLYGDGKHIEDAASEGPGSLSFGLHHITDAERIDLYGEEKVGKAAVSSGKDIAPYFCTAFAAEKRNGMMNLRKYFKTIYQKHEETVTQLSDSGVSYSMPTLKGTYSTNTKLGAKGRKVARLEVDPSTEEGQAIIAAWFTDPTYIGENTMLNTSVIQVNGTTVANGGTIASGDTVTFSGSATGGTAPYTYSFYYRAVGSDTWTTKTENSSTATATQAISVSTNADYEFKIVVKDANGVTLTKTYTVTVEAE